MKIFAVLSTAALIAAAPASIGLIGNASFSEDVAIRPPATGHSPGQPRSRASERVFG